MTYGELQKKAKEIGINSYGLTKKELEEAVNKAFSGKKEESEASGVSVDDKSAGNPESSEEAKREDASSHEEGDKESEANLAIVLRNGSPIRTYSLKTHGKDFKQLAQDFADKNKFKVELKTQEEPKYCKNCGHLLED